MRSRKRPLTCLIILHLFIFSNISNSQIIQEYEAPIDENLYSRQLFVMGKAAQHRLATSRVLIIGLSGLGAEIAKNLILAGVKSVTLHDTENVTCHDLASNFCLGGNEIGKNRAAASLEFLKSLNPFVQVSHLTEDLDYSMLEKGNYDCVLLADKSMGTQLRINRITRELKTKFISCSSRGVFGSVFCDFGQAFTVEDATGEEPKTVLLSEVEGKEDAVVTCVEGERHDFQTGDRVVFENVDGMPELCSPKSSFEVKVLSPFKFTVGDTRGFGWKGFGGRAVQVKVPVTLNFKPLKECIALPPPLVCSDFSKRDPSYLATLHACFCSLDDFRRSRAGKFPRPGSAADALKFKRIVQRCPLLCSTHLSLKQKPVILNENVVNIFSRTCRGSFSPMSSFLGGFAAQEVLKGCTGMFMPLNQLLYFDSVEVLPVMLPDEQACMSRGDRYDGLRAILGQPMLDKLLKHRHFVVGSGAIGCELLKMYALLGLGCSSDPGEGIVLVTDMDIIERSNLNRQFLFREKDIGSAKSVAAAAAVKKINPTMKIKAYEQKVAPETQGFFDHNFWRSVDCVSNALDNVEARLFVDSKCVVYSKPLLESGTLGLKGNTQVVVPSQSESYGSSSDPPETEIPLCTLKNFPFAIEHTIHWARDLFSSKFKKRMEIANRILATVFSEDQCNDVIQGIKDQGGLSSLQTLRAAVKDISFLRASNFTDCVDWAVHCFLADFTEPCRVLLRAHPAEALDEDGEPFWSGTKRPPVVPVFNPMDDLHANFVWCTARLRALAYGIPLQWDNSEAPEFKTRLEQLALCNTASEPFEPVEVLEEDSDSLKVLIEECLIELKKVLKQAESLISTEKILSKEPVLQEMEFEKDDDRNGHIDFIAAASNLRAVSYGISPADTLQTKKIAGKIVPAMATTTAVVAGLVGLELLKLIQQKPLEMHKNGFVNLAEPFVTFSEPAPAEKIQIGSTGNFFTLWDYIDVFDARSVRVLDLQNKIRALYGSDLKISSICYQGMLLYADFLGDHDNTVEDGNCSQKETVLHLLQMMRNSADCDDVSRPCVELEMLLEDQQGQDISIPPVRLHLDDTGKPRDFRVRPLSEIVRGLFGHSN